MGERWWLSESCRCPSAGAASALPPSDSRTLFCRISDNTYLYGIFDTHNGNGMSQSVIQKIANDILQSQLNDRHTDEDIKDFLRNAFLSVEKAYIESINSLIVERNSLQYALPKHLDQEKFNKSHANIVDRLKKIDEHLSIGVTSAIALVHKEKLFVANIGDSRALLCKTDANCVLRVVQLSIDHSLNNEDELLRLSQLGLDMDTLRKAEQLGNQSSTRCLGNYSIKTFYQSFPDLVSAISEPVIAVPEVHGPINLDQSCRFLVLVSDELYKNLQESIETDHVNKQFAQTIVEQFRIQSSMDNVCQAVVDKTMRLYREYCVRSSKSPWRNSRNTLLIRNFNFPLPNGVPAKSPIPAKKANLDNNGAVNAIVDGKADLQESRVRFNPIIQTRSPMMTNEESDFDSYTNGSSEVQDMSFSNTDSNREENGVQSSENLESTITSQFSRNSDFSNSPMSTYSNSVNKRSNKNEKIQAYVDFSQYYQNVEIAKSKGMLPANIKFE
ncbi:TGF-beta-activated kinase 1 and MAP3K7-binding protein 1-like isoform X2 [Arctopsyche grandis]|uniref:TGF-beta-activated kinase 1 and MAP3K7-binding protein 1-like isoform X2 n=1 Tax=Arctopsyche grandis TaxID=121162 RepID=UPI00406DA1B6